MSLSLSSPQEALNATFSSLGVSERNDLDNEVSMEGAWGEEERDSKRVVTIELSQLLLGVLALLETLGK